MKRKTYQKKAPSTAYDTQPLSETYVIKCIYNTLVKVNNAPSGTKYSFQPGETKTITNKQDYDHMLAFQVKRGGCCGGAAQVQKYFEAA